jgi:magnesium-transporting ATPase (P-type)
MNIILLICLDIIMSGRLFKFVMDNGEGMHYIYPMKEVEKKGIYQIAYKACLKAVGSYYLLFNQLIPLTIVVILEMSKVNYTTLIEGDADMVLEDHFIKNTRGCSVQNLSIIEELGQVNYIFSDKTGTLTNNVLSFRELSTPGNLYQGAPHNIRKSQFYKDLENDRKHKQNFLDFWRCVCLCNDAIVFQYDGASHYSGSSQDEIVLLEAGRDSEFCWLRLRDSDYL